MNQSSPNSSTRPAPGGRTDRRIDRRRHPRWRFRAGLDAASRAGPGRTARGEPHVVAPRPGTVAADGPDRGPARPRYLVRDPEGLTHPAVVGALTLAREFLVEVLEIRAALGPAIGRLAAERHTPDDAEALGAALAAVPEADMRRRARPPTSPTSVSSSTDPQPRAGVAVSLGSSRRSAAASTSSPGPTTTPGRWWPTWSDHRGRSGVRRGAPPRRSRRPHASALRSRSVIYSASRVAGCTAMSPNLLRRLQIASNSP